MRPITSVSTRTWPVVVPSKFVGKKKFRFSFILPDQKAKPVKRQAVMPKSSQAKNFEVNLLE